MLLKDLSWQKFNKLTFIRFSHVKSWWYYWECKCDCWKTHIALSGDVKNWNTKSCWCHSKYMKTNFPNAKWHFKVYKNRNIDGLFNIYNSIKTRCNNINSIWYKHYWWRGIKCLWKSFEDFRNDMWDRPKWLTIDRIDNNGNYCKENCRRATKKQQQNNTRKNILLDFDWETKTMKEWSEKLWIPYPNLRYRIKTWHTIGSILSLYKN